MGVPVRYDIFFSDSRDSRKDSPGGVGWAVIWFCLSQPLLHTQLLCLGAEHAPGNGNQVNRERQGTRACYGPRRRTRPDVFGFPVSQVEDPVQSTHHFSISPRGSIIISSHTLVVRHHVAPARRRRPR